MVPLTLSSALFLSLLGLQSPTRPPAEESPEKLFLSAQTLTGHAPMEIRFHRGEVRLGDNNREALRAWAREIAEYSIPVHVYSYAAPPQAHRDMTADSARHDAVRVAFNRALIARALLENAGITEKRIILHAIGNADPADPDRLEITIRTK